MRLATILLAGVALLVASLGPALLDRVVTARNAEAIETVKAVRAGLLCVVARTGALPGTLSAGTVPPLCRALAGTDVLRAVEAREIVGYRLVTPTRYRICARVARAPDLFPGGPAFDAKGCIEETVTPASVEVRSRRMRV